jgi:hypothetical protein
VIEKFVPEAASLWKVTPFTVTASPHVFTATVYSRLLLIPESASPVHGAWLQV